MGVGSVYARKGQPRLTRTPGPSASDNAGWLAPLTQPRRLDREQLTADRAALRRAPLGADVRLGGEVEMAVVDDVMFVDVVRGVSHWRPSQFCFFCTTCYTTEWSKVLQV